MITDLTSSDSLALNYSALGLGKRNVRTVGFGDGYCPLHKLSYFRKLAKG